MTLSNITSLSAFTDNAPLSPAYFNSKWSEVQGNFESLATAGNASDLSALWSRNSTVVYVDQMAGSDWGAKVLAAYSIATHGCLVDASRLSGAQTMSSTVTLDVPYTTFRWSSAMSLNMSTFGIRVPAATHGITMEPDTQLGWGARAKNGAFAQGQFDYRGTGDALVVGSDQTATLNFTLKNFGLWLGGSNASARGIILNQCLYFDLEKPQVLGKTGSTHSNIGIVVDGTDTNNSLFAGWGTIRQPILARMWRGIVGTGTEPYSANAITVLGGSLAGMGSGVSGARGISVDNGRGWFVFGTDVDGFHRGVHLDTANHYVVIRGENNGVDGFLASTSSFNYFYNVRVGTNVTNSGSTNIVISDGTVQIPGLWATSGISVGASGNAGSLIPAISSTSSLVAAFVVQGSASSFTIITWAAVKANDIIMVTPTSLNGAVSSLSSGIVAHSHCTQNGQVELRLSNVSTLAQNVSSKTWFFTRITPF